MKSVIRYMLLIFAAAACGFGVAHWADQSVVKFDWKGAERTGLVELKNSRLTMHSGSTLRLDLDGAKDSRSCIVSFDVDFLNLNNFAVDIGGVGGTVRLVDAHLGLGLILEKRRGLIEIGFERGMVYLHLDGAIVREFPYSLSELRSLTIDMKNSAAVIGSIAAVARDWKEFHPVDAKTIVDLDFAAAQSQPLHLALIIPLSILAVFLYCFIEKSLIYIYAKPAPRSLERSQLLAFAFLGAGLSLAAMSGVLQGGEDMIILAFAYHRLRFALARTELVARSVSPALFALSATCAGVGVALMTHEIGAGLPASAIAGGGMVVFFVLLAWLYAFLNQSPFRKGLSFVAWAGLPMAQVPLVAKFFPFAVAALGWPAFARRKNMRHAGPVMLFCALLFFPAAELAVRANIPANELRAANVNQEFEEHELLFYVPRNLFQYGPDYLNRDNFSVKALNLRGGQAPFEKPEGVFRVLVLGGSNAWGHGIDDPKDTFSGRLDAILNEQGSAQKFQVLNGGVRGYNSFQVMIFFTRYAYQYNPDLVILYLNRNDVVKLYGLRRLRDMLNAPETDLSISGLQGLLRHSKFYNLLTRRMARLRNENQAITNIEKYALIDANPPDDVKQNMLDVVNKARSIGAKTVVVSEFWATIWHEKAVDERFYTVRNATKQLVSEENLPYFDAYSFFVDNYEIWDVAFRHDPVHMTAYAHDQLAQALSKFLVEKSLIPIH